MKLDYSPANLLTASTTETTSDCTKPPIDPDDPEPWELWSKRDSSSCSIIGYTHLM